MQRPDCFYCNEKDSAFCLMGGQFACSSCLLNYHKATQQQTKRLIELGGVL